MTFALANPLHRDPLMSIRVITVLVLSMGLGACATAPPAPLAPRPQPRLERLAGDVGGLLGDELRAAPAELLGPVTYDLPVVSNSWVESEMNFLMSERRDVIERWMERGDVYKDFVQQVFREHGIPTDLYHIALIESGFQATVRSSAGAVGPWQFMPATGREVGLRIEDGIDERMDPIRATRAAARHLRSLYRQHGDWALAAAAYNAGSGRISRGLERFSVTNFWDLAQYGDLAEEPRHYVPRLYAMTIIHRNRERLGISSPTAETPLAFDSVHVDFETPLGVVAELGSVSSEELVRLNPHLTSGSAPGGGYWLWVPGGKAETIQEQYMASDFRRDQGLASYVVRWGDSLGRIVQRSGLTSARVRQYNPSIDFDHLMAGATIKLPAVSLRQLTAANEAAEAAEAAGTSSAPSRTTVASAVVPSSGGTSAMPALAHTVRAGDTLWDLARTYGVTIEAIQQENGLEGRVIQAGQELRIRGDEDDAGDATVEVASIDHRVQSGDTLSGIAQKYGSSVAAIQEANALASATIRIGQRLTVPF